MSGKVFEALSTDPVLQSLGVQNFFTDYSAEEIPRTGLTMILRWGDQSYQRSVMTGTRDLAVWLHSPMEFGTDYTAINNALDRVTEILEGEEIVQVPGADGVQVTEAAKIGSGSNQRDPGFNTIMRTNRYRVLLRRMV